MYVCVGMYIFVHLYAHAYLHTSVHTLTHTRVQVPLLYWDAYTTAKQQPLRSMSMCIFIWYVGSETIGQPGLKYA